MLSFQRVRIREPRFRSFRLSRSGFHHEGFGGSVVLSESSYTESSYMD